MHSHTGRKVGVRESAELPPRPPLPNLFPSWWDQGASLRLLGRITGAGVNGKRGVRGYCRR